jgi:hypothetical protein
MKKLFIILMILCFTSIAYSATLSGRTYTLTYGNIQYTASFEEGPFGPDERGYCYISSIEGEVMLDYWYKPGEVVRIYGFSDFLLGPSTLTQIIYGVTFTESKD